MMHREYRPEDLHHLDGQAVTPPAGEAGHHHERALFAFTALLGALIAGDALLNLLGWDSRRLPLGLSLTLVAAVLGAAYIVHGALQALLHGRIGADLALAQACLAALILGQPFVAAEVVFIALLGEVLEAWTFAHTRRALGRLVDQTPRTARVRRDGKEVEIPAQQVAVGDRLIVGPGERIAVDGTVVTGRSTVDQSALTGESLPIDKGPGDAVFTGTLNQFGAIEIEAEKVGGDTTFGQVLRLVSDARRRKAQLEKVADRLARYFLPVVELVAGATLLAGYLAGWPDVWSRTVAVLVVACPCGLVLATPAAMLASMAWLARHGVLIKGGSALESLASCDTFAFDKTGTLTRGVPQFTTLVAVGGLSENDVLGLAASAEGASRHPLAKVVIEEARRRSLELFVPRDATLLPGAGVRAEWVAPDESIRKVVVGNRRLLAEAGMTLDSSTEAILGELDARGETALFVAVDGAVAGVIGVRDAVRAEAHDVIHDLRHRKIKEIAILTGDREPAARAVARRVHAGTVEAELLPADKARWIEERQQAGHRVAMVGDGINDAPALAQADAGIALGGIGADLAAEAGDLIVLGGSLRVLPDLVGLSRATITIIRQNIIGFAFGFNAVAMLSATFGILGPVAAAILHQVGSLLVLLNSMRLLVFGDWRELAPVRRLRQLGAWIGRLDDGIDLERAWDWTWSLRRAFLAGGCALLCAGYAVSGWTVVGPDEAGLLQRFGRYQGMVGPGLHVGWPWPIERVTAFAPDRVRSLEIGFRATGATEIEPLRWESTHGRPLKDRGDDEALLLTGDGRYVELAATLQFSIDPADLTSLRRYVFEVADGENALRPIAESVVRDVLGRRPLQELLTGGRREAEVAAAQLLQERLVAYRFGIVVRGISFQDIHPPLAVVDAYRDVSRASSDRQRRINEANAYLDQALAEAKGKSQAVLHGAEAARAAQVAQAASGADTFNSLREARRYAPALTDFRLFWDKLAGALAGKAKVVLDEEPGRRRHLIVPNFPLEKSLPVLPPVLSEE
ncbi:MAG: cation-translocating P-type ATPase family protein [Isosphaerales bacterium]